MNEGLKKFLLIGNIIAKQMVPGIAQMEYLAQQLPTLKGAAKQKAIVDIAVDSVLMSEGLTNKDFVQDETFTQGVAMMNDGLVLVMKSIQKHEGSKPTP